MLNVRDKFGSISKLRSEKKERKEKKNSWKKRISPHFGFFLFILFYLYTKTDCIDIYIFNTYTHICKVSSTTRRKLTTFVSAAFEP